MIKGLAACCMIAGLMTACSVVGPNYEPPQTPLGASFVGGGGDAGDVTRDAWWERLGDKQLNVLVARGLAQNIDIETAIQRIKTAEATARQAGVASQLSGGIESQTQRVGGDGLMTENQEQTTFGATYVLDLFGGVRRGVQQAAADVEAAQYDAGTVRLAFLSEITSRYIDARYYQQALALARQAIESRRRTLSLGKSQIELGAGSNLDLPRAQGRAGKNRSRSAA